MHRLPTDCLNEIFEYLEKDDDDIALHSCLLVNRLWCEVSVRILWKSVWNYSTLIACLPNESKDILYRNKIIISTQTSKPPLFNYIEFIKSLSIHQIDSIVKNILINYQSITPQSLDYKKSLVAQEIYKSLMNQISLRELHFYSYTTINIPNIIFTSYPGAKDCLKDLRELSCRSDIYPEFYYQLSQVCHNIQYLDITFGKVISNGITDLISAQQNLKYLEIMRYYDCEDLTDIISSLTKLPNTLIKLDLYGGAHNIPLSFISRFTNLQELVLSFHSFGDLDPFEDFNELQHVNLPQLQVLKFPYRFPRYELLITFLEKNGKNLKEFYLGDNDNTLNLAIAKFCPNLKTLSTLILNCELETLEKIFNNCQYLESIKVKCGDKEKELLEIIAEYSPKNFYELELYYMWDSHSELLPGELESFFISWANRIPQRSLSLIIVNYSDKNGLDKNDDNMKIIEKYIKLGVIKNFKNS